MPLQNVRYKKASSVTDMLKSSRKRLVSYQKYEGVTLTDKRFFQQKMIVRKLTVCGKFLVDELHF
jgi:DtxR family Mn-dependent transcriptional regulator